MIGRIGSLRHARNDIWAKKSDHRSSVTEVVSRSCQEGHQAKGLDTDCKIKISNFEAAAHSMNNNSYIKIEVSYIRI